jgi:thiamine-phosphate pyrophosphorylase
MRIIAITSPDRIPDEKERIIALLQKQEADILHLRKPSWTAEETEALIKELPRELHGRIVLHDHFELAAKYPLYGIHLNRRNPDPVDGVAHISRSCHTIGELADADRYSYVTLSPIFDSISKQGYKAAFDISLLPDAIKGKRVVALGGVTPDRFPILQELGFFGAAMLGHFWKVNL